MQRIRPDVDIIRDVLDAVLLAQPESAFTKSLLHQYIERGGLSKKQLEGLYSKAQKAGTIPINKMATLEAIILKKYERQKSTLPENTPLYSRNEETGKKIDRILEKYPLHKRVLFLKTKYDNNELLSAVETGELDKFIKMIK